MLSQSTLLLFLLSSFLSSFAHGTKGVLSLDSYTFPKIVDGDSTVLVKFDKDYSSGYKEDAFKEFAIRVGDMGERNKLVVAQVLYNEYGDNKNEDLLERFGVKKEDFPVFKLFHRSTVGLPYEEEVAVDLLSNFVRKNSGIYTGASGTLEEFDSLAAEFVCSAENRKSVIAKAKEKVKKLDESAKDLSDVYLGVMEHVIERGEEFIESETKRVTKLLDGKVKEEKKKLFNQRINVLASFANQVCSVGEK